MVSRLRPLRRGGRTFPVVCFPELSTDVDSILGPLSRTPCASDPKFQAPGCFNGRVFALERLHTGEILRLDCKPGRYFDSLRTSEALELGPKRRVSPGELLDGSNRCAGIGVATLVAYPSDGGYEVLLARINKKAAPHRAGQFHVIPAGMFAPPYSVRQNVWRELREELPGARRNRRTQLWLTGVAINLKNCRPEICTLLLLDERPGDAISDEYLPGLRRITVKSDPAIVEELELDPGRITPPGVAALFLGLSALRQITKP